MSRPRDYWEALSAGDLTARHWTLEEPSLVAALTGWHPLKVAVSRSNQVLVDVACGNGALNDVLSLPATSTYIGIDVRSRPGFMEVPSRHRKAYLVADAVALPLRSSTADLVFAMNVLPFIVEDADALIAEIDRVLTPGGLCCLSYPTPSRLWVTRGPERWPAQSVLPAFVARGLGLVAERAIRAEPRGIVKADLEPEIGTLWLLEKALGPQRRGAAHVSREV